MEVPVLMSSPGSSCTQGGGVLPEVFAHRRQVAGRPLGVPVLMGSPDVLFGHVVRWPSVRRTQLYGNLSYNVMIPFCTKFAGSKLA